MTTTSIGSRLALVALVAALLGPATAAAVGEAKPGEKLANPELRNARGGRATLLAKPGTAPVSMFVFVRPGQKQSQRALEILGQLRDRYPAARIVAVVSGSRDVDATLAMANASSPRVELLVDESDEVASALNLFSVPVAGIVDAQHRLISFEFFTKINYEATLDERLAAVLGPTAGTPPGSAVAKQ